MAVREFARVLAPGGILGFADNISVEDPEGAAAYNAYEKLRDPSHHEVLPLSRLIAMFEREHLHVESTRSFSKEFLFEPWADRMHVSAADKARLLDASRGESLVELTLHSGKNRIVRRMMAEVGHPVVELVRRQFGPLHLGTLPVGKARELTTVERGALLTLSRRDGDTPAE